MEPNQSTPERGVERADLIGRLEQLLKDLDTDFQERGLYFEENMARSIAREMVSLHRVYKQRYGEDLFYAFSGDEARELIRARQRLHDLEGDHAAIGKLIRAVGEVMREVRTLKTRKEE